MVKLDSFLSNSYQKGKKKGLFLYSGKLSRLLSDSTIMYMFYMDFSGRLFWPKLEWKKNWPHMTNLIF